MKATIAILGLSALTVWSLPSDYVNFVRQIQQDSGVEWDVSVAASGEMLSPEGVGEAGSLFELWSVHALSWSAYLLDEEFVSAYTPEVTIEIQSLDPYEERVRTRVDQPFQVSITVDGLLLSGPDVPMAATQVLMIHEAFAFPEGFHGFPEGTVPEGFMADSGYLDRNGMHVMSCPVTSIAGDDLTQVEGEEVFTAYALSDTGVGEEVLDTAKIEVWPIANGAISGLGAGVAYETLPPIRISLVDLYPASKTHVRIYPGAPGSGGEVTEIASSFVLIDDVVPQDRELWLTEIDHLFPKAGEYSMEVLHETPFGIDMLDQVYPILIKRGIEVRGSLYAAE